MAKSAGGVGALEVAAEELAVYPLELIKSEFALEFRRNLNIS